MLIVGMSIPAEDLSLTHGDSESFSSGWTDPSFGGMPYDRKAYNLPHGASIVLEHVLPSEIEPGTVLTFLTNHFHIVASVDGVVVYESGKENPDRFGKELGRHWVSIPLEGSYEGKTIRIAETNNGPGRYLELYSARIGQREAINGRIFRMNLPLFVFCVVMVLIGLWLLTYYFVLRGWKVEFPYRCYLYLGLFTLASAVWVFSDSDIFFFFSGNASLRYQLSYFTFMLLPLLLVMFYRELSTHFKKTLGSLTYAYFATLFIVLVLYAANIVPLSQSLVAIHLFCVLFAVVLTLFVLSESVKYHDKTMLVPALALLALAIPSLINLALFYTESSYDNSELYRWGLLCFVLIVFAVTVRSSLNDFKDIRFARYYKRLAYVDDVTHGNTANRFAEEVRTFVSEGTYPYYFVHYDLVQFKIIRDALGQNEGDAIIKRVYDLIASCLNEKEAIGYLGDAKFGILVIADTEEALYVRLRKIWTLLSGVDSRNLGESSIVVQSSAVRWSDKNLRLDTVTNRALLAYGNPLADYLESIHCYVYNDACRAQLLRQEALEERMQDALKNGEFVIYLQPTIKLQDGAVFGAEALLRWLIPGEGLVLPTEFVPLFEKSGFITHVDLYVFKEVCMLINRWLAQGITPPVVSVNVSKTAINRYEVFRRYAQVVRETGVPPQYIDFEISERVAYKDINVVERIIDKIHSWGATVTIDDFGSASSNIHALGILPFDSMKIDRSFFSEGFPDDERKTTLVKGVINMAGPLGISVIAQGIESQPQVIALRNLDCKYIQGYVYSPPVSITEFERKYLSKPQKK